MRHRYTCLAALLAAVSFWSSARAAGTIVVTTRQNSGAVNIPDAVHLMRKSAGLDPKP